MRCLFSQSMTMYLRGYVSLDGRGTDEVRSYDTFLNDEKVVPAGSQNAQGPVRLQSSNTLKVILTGSPHSKILVLIAYDPRQPK